MTTQVSPIEQLAAIGVIRDAPAVGLPPNAFSDGRNIRFDDNAIRKIKGHERLFTGLTWTNIQHIQFWDNPNQPVYLVIDREVANDVAYLVTIDSRGNAEKSQRGTYDRTGTWSSTIFNGGYSIIINNRVSPPQYITDQNTGTLTPDGFFDLPNWNTYTVPANDSNTDTDQTNPVVTADYVIAFRNLLLAAGLTERDTDQIIIRELAGVVRSSSVAPLGRVPNNWNPFATGAGTADELLLADTGTITAIKELQGKVYVFTADSIHAVEITNAGLRTQPVTTQYGALSQDAVFEFDGKFMIIGSNDIYLFGGHPGSIQSVADNRVRRYFYDNLNPLTSDRLFVRRNQTYDELWVCYPTINSVRGDCDGALIWNVRNNTWTIRDLPDVRSGVQAPLQGGGAPSSTIIFDSDHQSGNTAQLNLGRQEVQTLAIDGGIRARHSGTAQVQSVTLPTFADFTTAGVNVFDLEVSGDSGPNAVNAVNTVTLPDAGFTFSSTTLYGGALVTLTDNVRTYNIPASSLSGLSGATTAAQLATAINTYINGDNITGFDWSSSVSGRVLTLTSDVSGPRTFTAATYTTYTGTTATITGSDSDSDDNNMSLVRTDRVVLDSDAASGTASKDTDNIAVTVSSRTVLGAGSLVTSTPAGNGTANGDTLSYITLRGTGRGNHTIVRYPGLNQTGHPTQIFSYQQDDNPGFTVTVRGGAHNSGDGPNASYTISGTQSIGWSGFTSTGSTLGTRATGTVYDHTLTNNTGHTLNMTMSPWGNDTAFKDDSEVTSTGNASQSWSWSHPGITGSTWTATNNRTDVLNPLQSGVSNYVLTVDGSTYNLGTLTAGGGTATQNVDGTTATATYSASVNAIVNQSFGPVDTSGASGTLTGGDVSYTRSAGANIAAISRTATNKDSDVGGVGVDVTTVIGSLGDDTFRGSFSTALQTYTVNAEDSIITIYFDTNDGGGNSGGNTSGTINVNGGGDVTYTGMDGSQNGAAVIPGTPSYAGWRGPNWQTGDGIHDRPQLSAGDTIVFRCTVDTGAAARTRRRTIRYDVDLANNNAYDVTLTSATTGISSNTTLAAGGNRQIVDDGTSNVWTVALAAINRYNYSFRKTVNQRVTITDANGNIADTDLTSTNVQLVSNTPRTSISVSGTKQAINATSVAQTAPTRASTTTGVGVYNVTAVPVTMRLRFGDSDSDDRIETDYRFPANVTDTEELRDDLFNHLNSLSQFSSDSGSSGIIYSIANQDKGIRFTRQGELERSTSLLSSTFATISGGTNYSQTQFGAGGLSESITTITSSGVGTQVTAPTVRIAQTDSGSRDLVITGAAIDSESLAGTIAGAINSDARYTASSSGGTITVTQSTASETDTDLWVITVTQDDSDVLPASLGTFTETTSPDNPEPMNPTVRISLPENNQQFDNEARGVNVELTGKLDSDLTAANVANRIADATYINWTAVRSGNSVVFTSNNNFPYNRTDNGQGTGTVNSILWGSSVNDPDSDYELLSGTTMGYDLTGTETTAGIAVQYGAPTSFTLRYNNDSEQLFVFGGDFNGLQTTYTYDPYVNLGHTNPFRRYNIPQILTVLQTAIRDAADNRVTTERVAGGDSISILPVQFGQQALAVSSTTVNQTGSTPPSPLAASFSSVTNPFTIDSEIELEFDPERPWPTNLIHEFRNFLVLSSDSDIYGMDLTYAFDSENIVSYIERKVLHLQPTREVEFLSGIYMDVEADSEGSFDIYVDPTNVSTGNFDVVRDGQRYTYRIAGAKPDYKIDIRETGRFMSVRISNTGKDEYSITGVAFGLGTGGTR